MYRQLSFFRALLVVLLLVGFAEPSRAEPSRAGEGQVGQSKVESSLSMLDDTALSDVRGSHGVLLDVGLRNNVDASGAPIGCAAVVNSPNPCRLGLEFAARNGVWLMLKEYYGTLEIRNMRLGVGFLPNADTAWKDENRFKDASGTCLILVPGCTARSTATVSYPVIHVTYPASDDSDPTVYDDLHSFLNIGRTWLEYDSGTTPGYQRDTSTNSVFGVRMSDSRALNHAADIRLRGTGYVFGF